MLSAKKPRSARALANDRLIRDAGVAEILRVGVDQLSLRDVGQRAGFTHGATYARYEDVDELIVDLWASVLCERASLIVELCRRGAERPSPEATRAIIDFVRQASPDDVAALHVLLTARRIPAVFEEIEPFIVDVLRGEEAADPLARAAHTRALAVFALLIALILANHHFGPNPNDLIVLEKILNDTFDADLSGDRIELQEANVQFVPAPTEELKSQLAYATFMVIGKSGYTHTTISRIARRAGCSPGLVYKLYDSKVDLVVSAFRNSLNARWMRADNQARILDEGHLAQSLYDTTSPVNAVRRNFVLEFSLAGVRVPEIHAAVLQQTLDLVATVDFLDATPDERDVVISVVRTIAFLTTGVTYLSAACDVLHCENLSQFTEPFRRSARALCGAQWDARRDLLMKFANEASA